MSKRVINAVLKFTYFSMNTRIYKLQNCINNMLAHKFLHFM